MTADDEELLARFNQRLAGIESEVPNPADSPIARMRAMRAGDDSPGPSGLARALMATVAFVALTAFAVVGLRLAVLPGPSPTAPAVGQTSVPSPTAQQSAAPTESPGSPSLSLAPTAVPSAAPSATSAPASTATTTPTSTPTAMPSPTATIPVSREWVGPDRISGENYDDLSLVVGQGGIAHIAAVAGDGIFYLTNATGSWTTERLTRVTGNGYDGQPSIAMRDDGSLAIAFTRFGGLQCSFGCFPVDPQGIYLLTNATGEWGGSPDPLLIEGTVQEPSLQAGTGDRLHLAFSRSGEIPRGLEYGDEDRTVEYVSGGDEPTTWTSAIVGPGRAPSLRIGSDGLARIAFDATPSETGLGNLYYAAESASGEFVVERVGTDTLVATPLLALNANNDPTIVFYDDSQNIPVCGSLAVRRIDGTWSDPVRVIPDDEFCFAVAAGVATDSDGALHVITNFDLSGTGIWYANDAGGEFRVRQLREVRDSVDDVPGGASAIAVDDSGRPHVVYVVIDFDRPEDEGLWYGIGPNG